MDEVYIRIQRQLAEREVNKVQAEKEKSEKSKGWGWGWFGSSKSEPGKHEEADTAEKLKKKIEDELSNEEKQKLFEVIGYQENAHHGTYPKDFEAYILAFR